MKTRIAVMVSLFAAHGFLGIRGESVLARIAALPPEGGTLRFEKGEYHFYEADAQTMWLDPSNNQSGEKLVVFPLVGRKNVTIDGCGSTFVFHGKAFPFAATNCTGLTFRNFTVTTRYPSCPGFVVKEKTKDGFTVKFDDGVCPYKVEQGNISFSLDGNEVSTRDGRLSFHSLDRMAIHYLMTPEAPGDKGKFPSTFVGARAEDLGNREVRFTYYGDKHPKCVALPYAEGEKVVINLEEKRYRDVFFFEDCDGVAVENVAIRRFGGMGVVGQRSGNIKVEGLSVHPHAGERVTVTADIVQFINCYGNISITGCEGGLSLDDWINIHGNYLKIVSVEGRCLRLRPQHPSQQGFFPYRPGDVVECVTARERKVLATARVCAVAKDAADPAVCVVMVDADLKGTPLVGHLVENATLNPDVTIRGNRFSDFPHLRLSGRGKYVIEGNRFERCMAAVLGMDLADYWFESGRIADMTIRNNAVVKAGGFRFGLSGWAGNEPNVPKVHGRVVLEGNTFDQVRGERWSAVGVRDFVVKVVANAPLPNGAPSDPWSLDGAWNVTSVTRARWSLNGLWGFRPALTNDVPDVVPGPEDNWGWGKIPSVWDTGDTKTGKAQDVWMSEWCIKHGVSPFSRDRAWYRRDFTMPSEADGKRIVLTFTMLQTRAVVYVDGARAGEVTFPGGEVDITDFAKPGRKQSIVLDVTAYWPDSKMVDFSTPHSGGLVQRKGVTGDVYLDIRPKDSACIADATVESDVVGGKVTFAADIDIAGGVRQSPSPVRLVAKITDIDNNPVCAFTSGEVVPNADGRIEFTADWTDARRWDVHTPGNRYVCRLEMHDRDGRMIDALLPFGFGFRDVRIAGRDLLLNGLPIHLRSNIVRTMNASAGSACKASALALCRRLKDRGYNHVITCNYSFNPGEASYMDALLEACDESGVLVSFSLPNVRDFGFNLDDSETEARYRALTRWVIRRARNHPSVITWTMSHNTMGYAGNMNPLRIDGIYELKDSPNHPLRRRRQAEHAARVARSLDKTRPIYHHESGNLDDFHTANIYLNWAPIQERSDWLQHWSESGVKPCFFVEWGMPHKASWSSYRGPQFIWGSSAYQSLWASEFAAMFRGDAAYEGDTPEVVNALRSEEKLWAGGEPFFMWPLLPSLHALTNNYYGIQARYMSDNWRCHRAWGVTAMLPWDMMPWGESKTMRENPQRWQNLKAPGIVPDYIGVSGWDTAFGDESCGTTTAVEESLARWNGEDCAFIGGGGVFTDKRHHFRPGEKVKKTLVILNDRRVPQDVAWTCELTGCGSLKGVVAVPPGERRDVPVAFALPTKAGSFEMSATFSFADGKVQRDVFLVESYEPVEGTAVKDLLLFDPRGMTAKQFDRLGIAYERADGAAIRQSIERQTSGRPPMVIGRTCLTREVFDEFVIPTAKAGGRVLVFEQDKAALESVGFRVQSYGLRDVFPRFRDSDLNLPLNESMLRDWNGEATLLPPYLEGVPETEVGFNTDTWAGFRNTRVWRCRNRGNVASVIPEKPTIGDWRALVDGGFDLQYAPLLDWTIGGGRITFCQLDVTARTVDDPVADDLVRCLVSRLGNGSPINAVRPYAFGQKAWMLARDLGTEFMQTYYGADSWQSCVYVVSSGAHKPKWFDAKIASGGRALCLGLTAKEVAEWCPVPLVMATTNGCYAARIDAPPCELNGLSNADWSWHGAMSFDGFTEPADDGNQAIRVVRHGKGYFVFWQVPPWKIDEVAKPYLRTTKRRAQYMLCRILSNMGCNFGLPAIRYADVPIAEDDPYRYYRW